MALYGIKDSGNITLISNATKKQVLYANYANNLEISFSSSQVVATKKGVKAITWDSQREGSMSMSAQVFDLQWIALLMGSEFKAANASDRIAGRKVFTVANATGTFDANIVAGSLTIFKLEDDNVTHAGEYAVTTTSTVEANKYKITSASNSNTVTFATGETGTFVAYYLEAATTSSKKFTVELDKYPGGYSMYFDTTIKADGTGVEEMVQVHMGNIKPQSNVTLSFDSENAATLDITFDILPDANNNLLEFTTL